MAAAAAVVATSFVASGVAATEAQAAPAPYLQTAPGTYSTTVPVGACAVVATVQGGAGGTGGVGYIERVPDANGAGARIVAKYPVKAGQAVALVVGGSGKSDEDMFVPNTAILRGGSGDGAGGDGGETRSPAISHRGGGGGGGSSLTIAGTLLVTAGGGGGHAGGHSETRGWGGDAGVPTALNRVAAGNNGRDGKDANDDGDETVSGGGKGGASAAGAGGHQLLQSRIQWFRRDGTSRWCSWF